MWLAAHPPWPRVPMETAVLVMCLIEGLAGLLAHAAVGLGVERGDGHAQLAGLVHVQVRRHLGLAALISCCSGVRVVFLVTGGKRMGDAGIDEVGRERVGVKGEEVGVLVALVVGRELQRPVVALLAPDARDAHQGHDLRLHGVVALDAAGARADVVVLSVRVDVVDGVVVRAAARPVRNERDGQVEPVPDRAEEYRVRQLELLGERQGAQEARGAEGGAGEEARAVGGVLADGGAEAVEARLGRGVLEVHLPGPALRVAELVDVLGGQYQGHNYSLVCSPRRTSSAGSACIETQSLRNIRIHKLMGN